MQGKSTFTAEEAAQLRELIREKQTADRDRQKTLRSRMRRIGFYITDHADFTGFTVSDSDDLVGRGDISIEDSGRSPGAQAPPRASARRTPDREPRGHEPTAWYEDLRSANRPERLRVLLIAESPPDPGSGERRFFYSPQLTIDNLYRGVAEAVYGESGDVDLRDKPAVLGCLREDGFWLIDAVEAPVNKKMPAARRQAIEAAVPRLVERCVTLAPEGGVIICHAKVYAASAAALRRAGVNVLHDPALPFPLGNWRRQFVSGFRRALAAARPPDLS